MSLQYMFRNITTHQIVVVVWYVHPQPGRQQWQLQKHILESEIDNYFENTGSDWQRPPPSPNPTRDDHLYLMWAGIIKKHLSACSFVKTRWHTSLILWLDELWRRQRRCYNTRESKSIASIQARRLIFNCLVWAQTGIRNIGFYIYGVRWLIWCGTFLQMSLLSHFRLSLM